LVSTLEMGSGVTEVTGAEKPHCVQPGPWSSMAGVRVPFGHCRRPRFGRRDLGGSTVRSSVRIAPRGAGDAGRRTDLGEVLLHRVTVDPVPPECGFDSGEASRSSRAGRSSPAGALSCSKCGSNHDATAAVVVPNSATLAIMSTSAMGRPAVPTGLRSP
jgi:hypothetical protein